VKVLATDDPLAIQARALNIGFFSRMVRKTPWVRMKIAASLDGKTALDNGISQWITSPDARADGHAWRARSCATLTGIGTVLSDDPLMDVRLVETTRQPKVVVVDSRMRTPLDAKILNGERMAYIYCAAPNAEKTAALEKRGATVIQCPDVHASAAEPRVDLRAMLFDLGKREINELHVEAGRKLNGALIQQGLADEFLIYLAPKLLGQGRDMASFGPLTELNQALDLEFLSTTRVGPDLRVVARVPGRHDF
jgi:diaminohydroxyphosphoribosylaminopyrimidine deaminase/5-amino-6-(5-phosphoribosylamino)uracil reductase